MRQEKRQQHGHPDGDNDTAEPNPTGQQRREKLEDETESMLDEIDDVLEENAEVFVRSYVQKGGQ
ncbi:ubiquitin-like protein Pup [Saccharopolyspora phatthalungensis]|uniref:Prokaryotic ubiquitin-like protein Pup n=1 Tax=Saccharopolyspora phatthalungensis TaxID=664693 RepID=A0A840Q5Z4_9PSEU|nr:ubiquitin-like protein Pup [Saccharopolyspora phatthalungensis]MBB5156044.1 ubiquitin-like protein Pup [Saccharopolyspora phatthalungensis]